MIVPVINGTVTPSDSKTINTIMYVQAVTSTVALALLMDAVDLPLSFTLDTIFIKHDMKEKEEKAKELKEFLESENKDI